MQGRLINQINQDKVPFYLVSFPMKPWIWFLLSVFNAVPCGAVNPVQITGTIQKEIPLNAHNQHLVAGDLSRTVTVLRVNLSDKVKKVIHNRLQQRPLNASYLQSELPASVQLGMNNVPVFEQGQHGTCVTFAVTAALDALLGEGDYISQLCLLELGQTLARVSYNENGWKGSFPQHILHLIRMFGYVTNADQLAGRCGDVTEYPANGSIPEQPVSLEDYHQLSHHEFDQKNWNTLLDFNQDIQFETPMDMILQQVKAALNEGDRVIVGTLLFPETGYMGITGTHQDNQQNLFPFENITGLDTWVLTPLIASLAKSMEFRSVGEHVMIITGYDDNAIAFDKQGRAHRGLLTLRNSWGSSMGNQGDFYMDYDYFNLLVVDLQRIRNFY